MLKASCRYSGRNFGGRNTVGTYQNVLLKAKYRYSRYRNIQLLPYLPPFFKVILKEDWKSVFFLFFLP